MISMFLGSITRHRTSALGVLVGLALYLSYGAARGVWANPTLILAGLFVSLYVPEYSRISNKIECRLQELTATLTVGRLGRVGFQFFFNTCLFLLFASGGVVSASGLNAVGGILGAALLTSVASQGAQYVGQIVYRFGIGQADWNTLVALSANVLLAAVAVAGLPGARDTFVVASIIFGTIVFGAGVCTDLRSVWYPTGGIAVFFGTFNPFHVGHLGLVKRVLEERKVEKVIIHPTIIPKLHADALARGEIRIARIENGLQVYERTEKGDPFTQYFPTGTKFYAPEDRRLMIQLAIGDAGLSDRVEVAFMPDIYRQFGFRGVFREIRRQNPGKPIHGIHGSDLGAMMVRTIMDESGWYYPFAVVRKGDISATAIRAGTPGMTTPSVSEILEAFRGGAVAVSL